MSRITETFSISLPPEMMAELSRVQKEEHRTRSELVREALRHYFRVSAGERTESNKGGSTEHALSET